MTKINLSPILFKHVFDAANDLRIGSEMLESKFGQPVFPLRSTVVTAAFSAELYLKCLLYLSGKLVPKGRGGHDLKILYQSLGNDLQQEIMSNIKAADGAADATVEIMDKFKNTFGEWRYIYESQANTLFLNFKMLRVLVQALDKTVRNTRPEWNQSKPA